MKGHHFYLSSEIPLSRDTCKQMFFLEGMHACVCISRGTLTLVDFCPQGGWSDVSKGSVNTCSFDEKHPSVCVCVCLLLRTEFTLK